MSFGERSNFILNLINIIENNNNFYYNINSMKMSSNITTMFEYLHPIIPKYSFNDTVKQRSHVIKKDYNLLLTTVNRGEEKKKKHKQKLPQHTSKSS